jgi:hypothetical protein
MTGKDFGLAGVTDKLKRPPGKPVTGESITVLPEKGELDTVAQYKGKSDTVEPVAESQFNVEPVAELPKKDESVEVLPVTVQSDFREEALSRLSNPSIKVLQQAVEIAKKKPRIGVYSPLVSAAAEYLRETIPKYSASDEARKILEDEFEKRYPELVRRIKTEMKQT